ncbi:MAG: putative bifunctional diguanylate cyclase/phosphodiesterase [Phycisphaerales bacterium]|jgi:diguanylate cyclase (GGDEF)-like protein/PAS domain S-box-containing protein
MGADFTPDARLSGLLALVNDYYEQVERDRVLIENALAVNSEELESLNRQLRERSDAERAVLRSLTTSVPDLLFVKSVDGVYRTCNHAFERMLGLREDEVLGRTVHDVLPGDMATEITRIEQEVLSSRAPDLREQWIVLPNGERRCLEMLRAPYFGSDGAVLGLVGIGRDVTQKKQTDDLIWKQANFDTLTGLPNRRMLRERLEHEIRQADRARCSVGVLLIDLDHFKEINDTLGHMVGDDLLVEAARRISACTRESDTVARLGGDEFIVVLTRLTDARHAENVASKIIARLAEPFQLQDTVGYVSASVGITTYPHDAQDVEDLLKSADQAMYVAKRQGRNRFSHFTQGLQTAAYERQRLITDLREAIALGTFHLQFQPIVDVATGHIHKAEALLRWDHPVRGVIHPDEFIPMAEETGLIVPLGDWVFHEAARWAARWAALIPGFQVSVNVSPVQFRAEAAESRASWIARARDPAMPRQTLVIEITEGLILHTDVDVMSVLASLRAAGIEVAIDDFGTGYSSLAYLHRFDVDLLKIDQAFVASLDKDGGETALCEAIIVMAHKLGVKVVAEGVETQRQADLLAGAGCDSMQGYLYSRPIPPEQLEAILRHGAHGR